MVAAVADILVFRTIPDARNRNVSIATYFTRALGRALGRPVLYAPTEAAIDVIEARRPRLVIGLGSVAPDDIGYTAIHVACRKAGARLVYWLHDDPYEFDFNWKIVDRCDWLFSNDGASVAYYGSPRVSHLPLAADRDFHFARVPVTCAHRSVDVFFCGVAFPNRLKLFERLRGLLEMRRTEVLGDGWPAELRFCANKRLTQEEIRDAYGQSRIVVNVGRQYNLANRRFDIVPSTPGPRTFEAAAAGCVQAVLLEGMEIFDYYKAGSEILHFSSVSDFAHILERAQDEPEAMDAIMRRARERTLASHTYDHRAAEMLNVLEREGVFGRPVNA